MSSPEASLAELPAAAANETQEHTKSPSEAAQPKAKKARAPETFVREPGKSVLPFSRVQKILKADKVRDLVMVQREAAFLISRATEEFIGRFAEATQKLAEREGRSTLQPKDVVVTVRRAEEFAFLEELFPWSMLEQPAHPPKRRTKAEEGTRDRTMLDRYVSKPSEGGMEEMDEGDGPGDMDFVTNEDGTMSMIPVEPNPSS
ncbi:hypothetical protein BC628DRAFT_227722 [Trametes gibbosa]|nr:hypothetical protein BC628DRAFT_227722 [Trametes gibbosa]